MEAIIIHPENKEQLNAVKAVLKALKVPFEKAKVLKGSLKEESPYDPEFVKKIRESEKAVKRGETYKIPLDDIWK